jgi:ATP-dependent RNA helicase RhlE
MGMAQTGQGKTAAYLLPILNRLTQDGEAIEAPVSRRPQVLILAPTRELASQIGDALRNFSKGMRIYYTVVFGGTRFLTQQKVMDRGVQILVATPGRLMDHHRRGTIRLDRVSTLVLDEADRMLDMGFVNEVKEIAGLIPTAHQTMMFSATMSRGVRELAKELLHNPERLDVGKENAVATDVDHRVMRVQYRDKKPLLMHLLGREDVRRVLVFTRTKAMADVLAKDIQDAGLAADAIHGDREQSQRQKVLKDFRDGRINILVATDVAARGIDVPDITHVINYDMPVEGDAYVHRVGRTGRAGNRGTALSIATGSEGNLVRIVERVIGQRIPVDADHPFHDGRPDHSNADDHRPRGGRPRKEFGKKPFEKKPFEKKPFEKKDGPKPHRKGPREKFAAEEQRGERRARAERPAHAEKPERPQRHHDERPRPERRPDRHEERADRPQRPERNSERPRGEWRPENRPYRDDSPRSEQQFERKAGRPSDKKFGDRKFGDKKFGDKKFGGRKFEDRKSGEKFAAFGDHEFTTPRKSSQDKRRDERGPDAPAIRARDGVTAFRAQDGGQPAFKKKKPFKKKDGGAHAPREVQQKTRAELGKKRSNRTFERETLAPERNAGGFKPRTRRP